MVRRVAAIGSVREGVVVRSQVRFRSLALRVELKWILRMDVPMVLIVLIGGMDMKEP